MSDLAPSPAKESGLLLVTADARLAERARALLDGDAEQTPVRHVTSLRSALDTVDDLPPRCVLLDLALPDAVGVRAVQRLQLSAAHIPLVVVAHTEDVEITAQVLRAGAQDHLGLDDRSSADLARAIDFAVHRSAAHGALVASNQQLASFAAMVAHDLRSPLSVTTGMLQLVQRQGAETLTPKLQDLIARSLAAAGRATDLIGALLMYAQAKRPDDCRDAVDFEVAAQWAIDAVAAPDLVVDVGRLPTLTASRGAIRQVFQNLIGNAVKYSDDARPPKISVRATDIGDEWRIGVVDNGPGIAPENREAAFGEGERLGRRGDGFGLGLPAVRATIEHYGGRVWVEDAPEGPGAALVFTFPKD